MRFSSLVGIVLERASLFAWLSSIKTELNSPRLWITLFDEQNVKRGRIFQTTKVIYLTCYFPSCQFRHIKGMRVAFLYSRSLPYYELACLVISLCILTTNSVYYQEVLLNRIKCVISVWLLQLFVLQATNKHIHNHANV